MRSERLNDLLRDYEAAPEIYQATSYWRAYEREVLDAIKALDVSELRSGKYPILATFGFGDVVYVYHPHASRLRRTARRLIHEVIIRDRAVLPYGLRKSDIQRMAVHHCEVLGQACGAEPLSALDASDFGGPTDLIVVGDRRYTMGLLNRYVRYCFVQKHQPFWGDEVVVELGSGAGTQAEVLKKLYPDMTILLFDLPAQIFLCQTYLEGVFGRDAVVGTDQTREWGTLEGLKPGSIHCFGNWRWPLLRDVPFDLAWNAASFGEMEPRVVENYLSVIGGTAGAIFLMQARAGKETNKAAHVKRPITFADYDTMLPRYVLVSDEDAFLATGPLSQSGGYFDALWTLRTA